MSTGYDPPLTSWPARQWLARDIITSHRSRPFLLWKRCTKCRRRWPCPQRIWAADETGNRAL